MVNYLQTCRSLRCMTSLCDNTSHLPLPYKKTSEKAFTDPRGGAEISHSFTIIVNLSRCPGTLVVSLWELLSITGIVEVRRDAKVSLALVLFGCVE